MTTAKQIADALKRRHSAPEWNFQSEVQLENRRIDGVAVGMWGKNRQLLIGYEIKVSRSDFLHEMSHPEKSEAAFMACNEFYLVCPKEVLKSTEEAPEGWGVLHVQKNCRLRVVKKAIRQEACDPEDLVHRMHMKLNSQAFQLKQQCERQKKSLSELGETGNAIQSGSYKSLKERYGKNRQKTESLLASVGAFAEATGLNPLYGAPSKATVNRLKFVEEVSTNAWRSVVKSLRGASEEARTHADAIECEVESMEGREDE